MEHFPKMKYNLINPLFFYQALSSKYSLTFEKQFENIIVRLVCWSCKNSIYHSHLVESPKWSNLLARIFLLDFTIHLRQVKKTGNDKRQIFVYILKISKPLTFLQHISNLIFISLFRKKASCFATCWHKAIMKKILTQQ